MENQQQVPTSSATMANEGTLKRFIVGDIKKILKKKKKKK